MGESREGIIAGSGVAELSSTLGTKMQLRLLIVYNCFDIYGSVSFFTFFTQHIFTPHNYNSMLSGK